MAAAGDRLSGSLCAELPGGRCRFAMVRDKRWERIEASLA
jgi:type III restriction enzyme